MPFNVVAVDPRNASLVYAGSENGLWQSMDGGATFTKVVIFTYGRGAYVFSPAQ